MMRTIIYCLSFFSMLVSPAIADDENALNHYNTGMKLFNDGEYEAAKFMFQEALMFKPQDGAIITGMETISLSHNYGRKIIITKEERSKTAEYTPNQQLKMIGDITLNQARKTNPPQLKLDLLALREPTHDDVFDGGEQGAVVVMVENQGGTEALSVNLQVTLPASIIGLQVATTVDLGTIKAHETKISEIPVSAAKDVGEQNVQMHIHAQERDGFDSNELRVSFGTKPHQPPQLAITGVNVLDFNGNKKIEPTEPIEVNAHIRNVGHGMAEEVWVKLLLGDKLFLTPDSIAELALGALAPGESKPVKFSFLSNTRFKDGEAIPAEIIAGEKDGSFGQRKNLDLVMFSSLVPTKIVIEPTNRSQQPSDWVVDVDLDINFPKSKVSNPDAVAVLIGNSNYSFAKLPNVEYALNDVNSIKKYLIHTLGFNEKNIIVLEDATSARFNEVFGSEKTYTGKLFRYVKPGISDVFIYYAGHGAPNLKNNSAYFVPVDVDPNYIETSGYALETLYQNLSKVPARGFTIVLDTCFSGNSAGGFLLKNISPASIRVNNVLPSLKNATIFTSSGRDEVSTWYHDKKHSLFTYYFLKGLQGAADRNKDATLHSSELLLYLSEQVPYMARRLGGVEQTPTLFQEKDSVVIQYSGK